VARCHDRPMVPVMIKRRKPLDQNLIAAAQVTA
jgi:hypothetical protein